MRAVMARGEERDSGAGPSSSPRYEASPHGDYAGLARVGRWLLAAVVPLSVMALGSLMPILLVIVTVLAAASCALLWVGAPKRVSRATRWILIAWGLFMFVTLLQVVPLPAGVVHFLAPANAQMWDRALAPLREAAPAWQTISIAPAATRVELLRGIFYGCIFLAGLRVASEDGGTTFLERIVIFSASAFAFVTLAHAAVDAERVFGVYRPREIYAFAPGRYGPLLNVNHVAAYLNAGACVALGTLLSVRPALPRALALSAVVLLAGTSVWAASRGGAGALAVGVLATFALTLFTRRRSSATIRADVAIPIGLVVAAAAMIGLGLSDFAREDLASKDISKVSVALNAMQLTAKSPWLGFGRGGFEGIFPWVRQTTEYVTFTNPENIVAQWTSEWGVPTALAGAAAIAWALRPSVVLTAARPMIGAWAAVIAVVVHDLVDFHLEVPGVVALLAVCVAAVVGARAHSGAPRTELAARRLRIVAWSAAIASVPAALWVLPDANHLLAQDRQHLSELAIDRKVGKETFRQELRGAVLRNPGEAFFPLMGAVRAQIHGDESVVPWVARALETNPRFGRAHLVLARSLGLRYRAQALLEYRLAYANDVNLRDTVLKESPRLVTTPEDAFEVVPEGPDGAPVLDHLAEAVGHRLPSTAVILDAELVSREKGARGAMRRRVEASLSDIRHAHVWCRPRDICIAEGVGAAKELIARDGEKCESHLLLAKMRVAAGDPRLAFEELEPAVETVSDRPVCLRALVGIAVETKQTRRADIALDRVLRAGCGASTECADLYAWAGGMQDERGNQAAAINLYKRAVEVAPDRIDLIERIAELASHLGLLAEAIDAYSTLSRKAPSDARWPAALEEAKGRVEKKKHEPPR